MPLQSEVKRQFYLGVAGVSCWYARSTLSGAAPSPDFDFGETVEQTEPALVDEPVMGQPPQGQRRRQSLAAIQGLVSPAKNDPSASKPEPRNESARDRPETALVDQPQAPPGSDTGPAVMSPGPVSGSASAAGVTAAHWGFWFSNRFVLISALSADASTRLQAALAGNILQALGQMPTEHRILQWPVFSNPAVPGNDESGLKAVLTELAGGFNERMVVTLGLLPELSYDARSVWLESVLGHRTVEFPFSLAALSAEPDRKRQLWAELRPLTGTAEQ